MSLRMRIATQPPCLTPSRWSPPAMRAVRSATSAWSRRRWPLVMPRKSGRESCADAICTCAPSSNIGKTRRALVDIGAHRLKLIGPAHQFHLLDGFGQQRRGRIDAQLVEQTLGGADGVGTFARHLTRNFKGGGAGIVADSCRETVTQGFLGRENPARIG